MNSFPNGDVNYDWYAEQVNCNLGITKESKIVSMGSCFAGEIKNYLVNAGYNYLQVEDEKDCWARHCSYRKAEHRKRLGSAAWERVFHVHGLKQILEYSFGIKEFPSRLVESKLGCHDLLRTKMIYKDRRSADMDLGDHSQQSRKVLESCDVFIFTMGLVELWETNGMILGSSPKHSLLPGGRYNFKVADYLEILHELRESYHIFRKYNPNAKFVLTVSPVHLRASYRDDIDVLSATCYSKSVQRTAVNDFIEENPEVFYFPSYEIVTILSNIAGDKAYPDGHHVNDRVVLEIMRIFEKVCCQ